MKFFFATTLIASLPHLAFAIGPCNVKVNITESADGYIFSGTYNENPEGLKNFKYLDDDGLLTMNGTYLSILSSNNYYSSEVKTLKVSEAEKKRLVDSSKLMIKYNEGVIAQYSGKEGYEEAVNSAKELIATTKVLSSYLEKLKNTVPSDEFFRTLGHYIQTERKSHYYTDLNRPAGSDSIQFCTGKVRCMCSEINNAAIGEDLCLSDYSKPALKEYGACSYVNYEFNDGSGANSKPSSEEQKGSKQ